MFIIKEWQAMSFDWKLIQDRRTLYYVLYRDGKAIWQGRDRKEGLSLGWYI